MAYSQVKPAFEKFARFGYGARGVVYVLIGALAILSAFGQGGGSTDSKGALMTVYQQPFGSVLLGIIALGLVGYSAWRVTQGVSDTDDHGTSFKGLMIRGGLIASAITHGLLAFWSFKLALQGDSGSSGSDVSAAMFGQLGLLAIGAAFLVVGFAHEYKAITERFDRYLDVPADKKKWAYPICRFGLIARGVIWCLIGFFFVRSAFYVANNQVDGVAEALQVLRQSDFGPWLFLLVSAGLLAFGIYSFLEAVYRRIQVDG